VTATATTTSHEEAFVAERPTKVPTRPFTLNVPTGDHALAQADARCISLSDYVRQSITEKLRPEAAGDLQTLYSGPLGIQKALQEARQAVALIPALITLERLLFGLTTSIHEVREAEAPRRDDVAARIASDPEITALAIQLLDRALRGTPAALPAAVDDPDADADPVEAASADTPEG
jgi:hypothetical protein